MSCVMRTDSAAWKGGSWRKTAGELTSTKSSSSSTKVRGREGDLSQSGGAPAGPGGANDREGEQGSDQEAGDAWSWQQRQCWHAAWLPRIA